MFITKENYSISCYIFLYKPTTMVSIVHNDTIEILATR